LIRSPIIHLHIMITEQYILEMYGKSWPIDFNGDGFEEFVFRDGVKNPGSSYSINRYFFCETNTVLTTRDYHIFQLYPDTIISFVGLTFYAADLDGDGNDDFTIDMTKKYAPCRLTREKKVVYLW
jgi:hypothetical protein